MQRRNEPLIFQDRISIDALGGLHTAVLQAMKEREIGKVDRNNQVHFCGIVRSKAGQVAVFLPRAIGLKSLQNAKLTMSVLARYGREVAKRDFETDGDSGNSGMLAVIARLGEDFRQNGLFVERQRIRSKNVGKPDWKRTVTRERAFVVEGIGEIYPDIATTRTVDSSETLLAQVQAAVMDEIIEDHGWWIDGIQPRRAELRWQKLPSARRDLWPVLLNALLPRLYSARAIFLATYLTMYLSERRDSSAGSFVFGLEDFHSVWEAMLRHTLMGVEEGWNERLPRARYERTAGGVEDAPDRGMLTDVILRDTRGLTIVDAKYYAANSGSTVPGWPDIAKQMFYEKAVCSVEPRTDIRNCFVFPIATGAIGAFRGLEMRSRDGRSVEGFKPVECLYMPIEAVMEAYQAGRADLSLPALQSGK